MNIFIDTPQRAAERAERVRCQREGQRREGARYGGAAVGSAESAGAAAAFVSGAPGSDFDLDEVPGCEFMEQRRTCLGGGRGAGMGAGSRSGARSGADVGADAYARRTPGGHEPQSVAADAYRDEKAYDRKRMRRRKRGHVLRVLALIAFMPVAIVAVFLVSYVLTCVLNGATPDEVMASLGNLATRVEGFLVKLGML